MNAPTAVMPPGYQPSMHLRWLYPGYGCVYQNLDQIITHLKGWEAGHEMPKGVIVP